MFCGIYSGAWLAAAGVLGAGALWAQPPAEPLVAAPGTHLERRLAGGGTDTFRIPLAAGQFVHLEVIQKGSDLAVTLRDPEGHSLMDMDSANNRYGPETVAAIAGAAGDYRLEVKDGNLRDAATPYEVRVVELRQALSGDHNLVVALKNYNDGLRLWEQRTAAARQQAIEKHERARDFFRASGDGYMLGLSLFSLGAELGDSGEFRRALPVYQEAATLFRAAGDPRMEAQAFNNEGGARDVLGEPKEALRAYRQSLADHVQQGDRREQANLLNNIGVAEAEMGDWQNTLRDYRQAFDLCREAGDRRLQAIILNNTGVAYRNLGDTAQAQALFEQALPLRRAVGDKRGEATTLENLAETYRSIGQPAKALGYAEQALAPARALGDRRVEAGVLRFQASAYTDLRRYGDARRALQLALDLARAVQDRYTTGEVMLNLARAELSAGADGNAADWSAQALSEFRAVGDRNYQALSLEVSARAEEARGNLTEAKARIEEALRLNEEARRATESEQLRASFFATRQDAYSFYVDLLMRTGAPTEALEVNERAHARSLLEMLAEAGTDVRAGVDPKLLERERDISNSLNAKGARLLALGGRGGSRANELTGEIRALEAEYQDVEAAIRQSNPRYAALTQPGVLTARQIPELLDERTLLLEYCLGEQRSYLWLVSRNGVRAFTEPPRARIEEQVRQVLRLVTAHADASSALRELSGMVIGPVGTELGEKRLVIVPDGALQQLPFAMLPSPGTGEPLVARHELTAAPSASAMALVRREWQGRQPAPRMLAVFADPVFGPDDPRAGHGTVRAAANRDGSRILEHLAEGDSGDSGQLRIPRLPFTAQEADEILSVARAASNLKATGFQASRETALGGHLGDYRYLHFATHGYLDTERPSLSALVLSQVDAQGKPEDGFLRVDDIYNLRLSADLAVLSACQTGLGKEVRGEGLMGLTRAFLYAGVPRVIVSLWSVNDRATADLMAALYRGLLREGKTPAAALRAAQLELRKQKRWESPYYWAAFVQQGEWE